MKRIRYISAIAALLLGLAACTTDDAMPLPGDAGIRFKLTGLGEQAADTRAAGNDSYKENTIGRLDLFFCNAAGECIYYPSPSNVSIDDATKQVTTQLTGAVTDEFVAGKPITLYVLANTNIARSTLTGKSLAEIKNLVQTNTSTFNPTPFVSQTGFLMDGEVTKTLTTDGYDFGTIGLSRAAAKISLTISNANFSGYTATQALARLNNYLDKTVVGTEATGYVPAFEGDYHSHNFRQMNKHDISGKTTFRSPTPFYSYANDWARMGSEETYLTIAVDWLKDGEQQAKRYYYRVPVNYTPPTPGGENRRIQRNYEYFMEVDISTLGGLEPEESIVLPANFKIYDWSTQELHVDLSELNYLFVEEPSVEMHNIDSRQIRYASSHPAWIEIKQVYYFKYDLEGYKWNVEHNQHPADVPEYHVRETITSGSPGYPDVQINESDGQIMINSSIPDNYIARYIKFDVLNQATLTRSVSVTQYPKIYITMRKSDYMVNGKYMGSETGNNYPDGDPSKYRTNFNFYTINFSGIDPGDGYILGDPAHVWNGNFETDTREEANRVVSPQLVIATQRGITQQQSPDTAYLRCCTYWEGPYPAQTWRLPTVAELQLIARLQNDPKSAIKGLFDTEDTQTDWWTARISGTYPNENFHSVNMKIGKEYGDNKINKKHWVRCVHDVWRDK